MQTITYTAQTTPEATVAIVIDSETKEIILESSGTNLLDPKKNTKKTILDEKNNTYTGSPIVDDVRLKTDLNRVTSYIRVTPIRKNEDKEVSVNYTFSMKGMIEDTDDRAVCLYDKNKKFICGTVYTFDNYRDNNIGIWDFSPNNILKNRTNINKQYADEDGQIKLEDGETPEEAFDRVLKLVKYIRICYPYGCDAQFEEDDKATEFDLFDQPAVYYLFERNGEYDIFRENQARDEDWERVLPVKTTIISYNASSESGNETTPYDVAKEKLVPSKFNQAIEIRIANDSKMFDFQNAMFGDLYKIINERGTIDSVYTGKKITSKERWTTLYFGLGRQYYTDIMQIRLRKRYYNEVYNQ